MCFGAAGGTWWYYRQREPDSQPPDVDLSRADPEVARAITEAIEEVKSHPRDAARWGRLGMYLRAHDFDMESISVFRTAARLDPGDYRWPYLEGLTLVLFDPDLGLERLRKGAELAPPARSEPRLIVAERLLERGDLDGAAAFADAVLNVDPGAGRAHLILARVAAARQDWTAVLARAEAASADPGFRRPAGLLRGEAFAARGERGRADAELRMAAALPPPQERPDPLVVEVERLRVGTNARLTQASRLLEQGRGMDALALLQDVARTAPNNPRAALMLAETYLLAGDPQASRQVLEPFVGKFPESVDGWLDLGGARHQTGDTSGAVEAFRHVLKLKPDHAGAHFNLGQCHRQLGDRPAAKAAYEEALRCRPDYQGARAALMELEKGK